MPSLATDLQARGVRTAAFVSAAVLDRRFGLARGFDHYDDALDRRDARTAIAERSGEETTARALAWLRETGDDPVFLWVHYFDPHAPYAPRLPLASDPYDAEIAYVDRFVGELVAGLRATGRWAGALAVFTADHGESLGDHGERTHGNFLYDATLRVPLWIKPPHGSGAGRRVDAPVGLVDVAPTIRELAGLGDLDRPSDGTSLAPLLGTGPAGVLLAQLRDRPLYLEALHPERFHGWSRLRGVSRGALKYVEAPRPELYDRSVDPGERRNLIAERPEVAAELAAWLAGREGEERDQPAAIDPATADRLASLGYAGPSAPSTGGTADPKDRIHLLDAFHQAVSLARLRPAAGRTRLEALVEAHPRSVFLRRVLIGTLRLLGDLDAARATARTGLELAPDAYDLMLDLAAVELDAGRSEVAIRTLRGAEKARPELAGVDSHLHEDLGLAHLRLGETRQARRAYERALALRPDAWGAIVQLARIDLGEGATDAARDRAAGVVVDGIDVAEIAYNLGVLRERVGEGDRAGEAYLRALELDDELHDARFNLALWYGRTGDGERAEIEMLRLLVDRPEDPRPHVYLAQLAEGRGRVDEALRRYERFLAVPGAPEDLAAIARQRVRALRAGR